MPDTNSDGLPAEQPRGQFLVYQAEDGKLKLDVRLEDETVWLTQQLMADLFQTTKQNISQHVQSIYSDGELLPEATVKKYLTVRTEGNRKVKRLLDHYSLDMIISVGYRVKSHVATRFRIWATERLKEYIIKGFTLDDERLKNPDQPFDYFEELTRRIQDIRTSERRFYQKITDIYATSIDYDPTLDISIAFFKTVQNKMHWAITGQTAAEIIHERADADKPDMGLTNYRGAKVRKADVTVAKNYLKEDELAALNNLVEQYLVFAEGQVRPCVVSRCICGTGWPNSTRSSLSMIGRFLHMRGRCPMRWLGSLPKASMTDSRPGVSLTAKSCSLTLTGQSNRSRIRRRVTPRA